MTEVRWERYPLVAQTPHARSWLAIQANLGLAPNTVEAYGRALQDFLAFSARRAVAAESATREHIAAYVGDLTSRPNRRGAAVRVLDSGAEPPSGGVAAAPNRVVSPKPLLRQVVVEQPFGRQS